MAEANLSEDVYERLSERILRWDYPPGKRLTEEELCVEFGVSRSPVREALGMLAQRGLVDKRARAGYAVRRLDLTEIKELYDVRLVLELAVAEALFSRPRTAADGEALARLRGRWTKLRDGLPKLAPDAATEDEDFHRTLAALSGNRVLARILEDIDARIHFVRLADIVNHERLRATCEDHLAILDALEKGDGEAAAAALRRNIEWGKANVETAIKDALVRAHLSA